MNERHFSASRIYTLQFLQWNVQNHKCHGSKLLSTSMFTSLQLDFSTALTLDAIFTNVISMLAYLQVFQVPQSVGLHELYISTLGQHKEMKDVFKNKDTTLNLKQTNIYHACLQHNLLGLVI